MEYHISTDYDVSWLADREIIGGKAKNCYNVLSCFDIETTAIKDIEHSFMYIWQWIIGDTVYIGRTWEDFQTLVKNLEAVCKSKLIVYVHKLAYEMSFLKGILPFKSEDIFIMTGRRVLKADIGHIEFRCSYMLTNMSLKSLCEQYKPEHRKTEMEYDEERFSDTVLTPDELEYAVMDVVSLAECLDMALKQNNDTLITVPLTSTGYVRREARRIFR